MVDEQALTGLNEADRLKAIAAANRRQRHDRVANELTEQGWQINELTWYTTEQERTAAREGIAAAPAPKKGVRIGKGPRGGKESRVGTQGRQQGLPRKYSDDPLPEEQSDDEVAPRRSGKSARPDDDYVDQMDEDVSPVKKRGRPAKAPTQRKRLSNDGPGLTNEPLTGEGLRTYARRITKPSATQDKPITPRKLGSPFEHPRSLPRKTTYNKHQPTGAAMSQNHSYPPVNSMNVGAPALARMGLHHQPTGTMAPPPLPKPMLGQYDYNTNSYMPVAGSYGQVQQGQMQPPSAHMQAYQALQNQMAPPYQMSQSMHGQMSQPMQGQMPQHVSSQMSQPTSHATVPHPRYGQMPQTAFTPQGGYAAPMHGLNQAGVSTVLGNYGHQDGLPAPMPSEGYWGPPNYNEPLSAAAIQAIDDMFKHGMRRDSKFPEGVSNTQSTNQNNNNLLTQPAQMADREPPSSGQQQVMGDSFDQQHGLPSQPHTAQTSQYFDPAATNNTEWLIGQPAAFHEPAPVDDPEARANSRYNPLNMFPRSVPDGLPSSTHPNTIVPAVTMVPVSSLKYQDNGTKPKTENKGTVDPGLTMDGAFDGMNVEQGEGNGGDPDWDALMADGGFEVDAEGL
ncbi:hypothetical protein B0A48_13670 [Cryoendolithus antarcticus]|uniref:Uncharacterized protein n=1 Tax=Cryoendolithus antarcticus TaxID=1507870 RepID=A0A1V8SMH2_9PEZI|nr:hypothetical protein B0A48_13670 [Cryoendolithus antarcticus]